MERCVKMIGVVCLLVPVSGQQGGGVLCCQQTWEEDSNVKLTFFVDESRLSSLCTSTDNQPFFQRSTDGSSNSIFNCTVSDITASGACSGSYKSGSLGCGCTAKKSGYYVMEYNFIAHRDYNGWWSAGILCTDSSQNQILSFPNLDCDNKQTRTGQLTDSVQKLQGSADGITTTSYAIVGIIVVTSGMCLVAVITTLVIRINVSKLLLKVQTITPDGAEKV